MNKRVEDLIEEVRKLTPEERAELMARLSIELEYDGEADGTPAEIEAAWKDEARRRAAEVERKPPTVVPWNNVLAKLKK